MMQQSGAARRVAGPRAAGAARTSRASNRQAVEPSSRTSLCQRSPTISRPVTFFTVQKSKASSSTQMTNMLTKLDEIHVPKK